MLRHVLAASAAVCAFVGPALAQDYNLEAGYGSSELTSGFLPDPVAVELQAGGSVDASSLGEGCLGMIAEAPDYELTFEAGPLPLYLSVESEADTTLVVNAPDGSWICNDDSQGLNPGLTFEPAESGVYDIWVGAYNAADGFPEATLFISELGEGNLGGGMNADGLDTVAASGGPNWTLPPTYGTAELTTGFLPDPHTVEIQAGGELDASEHDLGPGCLGNIATAPDYDVVYTAGETFPLIFSVESEADTTLIINGPDGSWHCNDDTNGLNPQVTFESPQSGLYDVWVGTYYEGDGLPPATLNVSEIAN